MPAPYFSTCWWLHDGNCPALAATWKNRSSTRDECLAGGDSKDTLPPYAVSFRYFGHSDRKVVGTSVSELKVQYISGPVGKVPVSGSDVSPGSTKSLSLFIFRG